MFQPRKGLLQLQIQANHDLIFSRFVLYLQLKEALLGPKRLASCNKYTMWFLLENLSYIPLDPLCLISVHEYLPFSSFIVLPCDWFCASDLQRTLLVTS